MTTEHFETLLDQIHGAIAQADFAALENLVPEFETASLALQPGLSRSDLIRLQNKASLNSTAAAAAGRGVRAALRRVSEIRENAFSLRTYDRLGQRSDVAQHNEISRRL